MLFDIFPGWVVYALGMVSFGCLSLFFMYFIPLLFPKLVLDAEHFNLGNAVTNSLTILYSILIALVIVNLWQNFYKLDNELSREVSAITMIAFEVEQFPSPAKEKIKAAIRSYYKQLPIEHRPRKDQDIQNQLEFNAAYTLLQVIESYHPTGANENFYYSQTVGNLNEAINAKRIRISALDDFPTPISFILVFGALGIIFFMSLMTGAKEGFYFILVNVFIGVLIGFYLILVLDLNSPFDGYLKVDYPHVVTLDFL